MLKQLPAKIQSKLLKSTYAKLFEKEKILRRYFGASLN